MKQVLIFFLVSFVLHKCAQAQINVYSNNNVGVGAGATSAASTLSVNDPGSTSYGTMLSTLSSGAFTGSLYVKNNTGITLNSPYYNIVSGPSIPSASSSMVFGTYSVAQQPSTSSSGRTYGVYGIGGNASSGYNFGVYGQLNGTNGGAGIFGISPAYSFSAPVGQYAGYFIGDVRVASGVLYTPNGTVTTSDSTLKKNIVSIDTTGKLFQLNPVKYNLKSLNEQKKVRASISGNTSISDTSKNINLPDPDYIKKAHFGFLAQDLQKVYPDLVYTAADSTLGIDYQGLIPIIIAQMKQMKQSYDARIMSDEVRISALEQKILQLQKGNQ